MQCYLQGRQILHSIDAFPINYSHLTRLAVSRVLTSAKETVPFNSIKPNLINFYHDLSLPDPHQIVLENVKKISQC